MTRYIQIRKDFKVTKTIRVTEDVLLDFDADNYPVGMEILNDSGASMSEENYPGERDEMRRHHIVQEAVAAADRIIMDNSNGSEEETNYLTLRVAKEFFGKVDIAICSQLLRRELEKRIVQEKKI